MTDIQLQKGDVASWAWSGARPEGTVAEIKEKGDVNVTSNRGNTITRHGEPGDPAVHLARSGNDVVKKAHELTVEEKGNGSTPSDKKQETKQDDAPKPADESKDTTAGEKRAHVDDEKAEDKENQVEAKKSDEKPASKKQKTSDKPAAPKKTEAKPKAASQASKKKKEPKKAATADGKPRRSARLRD